MEDTEWKYTGEIEYRPIGFGGNWTGRVIKNGHESTSVRAYFRWVVWLKLKWEVTLDRWHDIRSAKNRAKSGKAFKL